MASDPSDLSAEACAALLDGIDEAFRQAVHARYGGGIELVQQQGGSDDAAPQTLREPQGEDRLRLVLGPPGGVPATAQGQGRLIGRVTLAPAPARGIEDVTVMTEIFDDRDVNEPGDATPLRGVVFAPLSDQVSDAGTGWLGVVRSSEAASAGGRQARQRQRGWLASASRNNPGRPLGLTTNGHRRAPPSSVLVPVSADLLTRIGGVVAAVAGQARAIGSVAVVVRIDAGGMA